MQIEMSKINTDYEKVLSENICFLFRIFVFKKLFHLMEAKKLFFETRHIDLPYGVTRFMLEINIK